MKKMILSLVAVVVLFLSSCSGKNADIVTTAFPGYDAARAVTEGTDLETKMLMKSGNDIHSYEPSAADIKSVLSCKVFIYVGGESDEWVEETILPNVKEGTIVVNMFDVLEDVLLLEDGEEDEYDEHVWTNVENYIKIVAAVNDAVKKVDQTNAAKYDANTKAYTDKLNALCSEIKGFAYALQAPRYVVVADRNPLKYMFKEFNVGYFAALNGCSQEKNVPQQKIVELKSKVEEYGLKMIFIVELSQAEVATSVKREVDNDIKDNKYNGESPKIVTLYSMQNISKDDFNSNKTYVDFMKENIKTLKELFGWKN